MPVAEHAAIVSFQKLVDPMMDALVSLGIAWNMQHPKAPLSEVVLDAFHDLIDMKKAIYLIRLHDSKKFELLDKQSAGPRSCALDLDHFMPGKEADLYGWKIPEKKWLAMACGAAFYAAWHELKPLTPTEYAQMAVALKIEEPTDDGRGRVSRWEKRMRAIKAEVARMQTNPQIAKYLFLGESAVPPESTPPPRLNLRDLRLPLRPPPA